MTRAYTRAVTFGSRMENEAINLGIDYIRRYGYIVIEADDRDGFWAKALEVCGEAYPEKPGTPAFSFDYDLEEFEAEEAERLEEERTGRGRGPYYPLGELARFSA